MRIHHSAINPSLSYRRSPQSPLGQPGWKRRPRTGIIPYYPFARSSRQHFSGQKNHCARSHDHVSPIGYFASSACTATFITRAPSYGFIHFTYACPPAILLAPAVNAHSPTALSSAASPASAEPVFASGLPYVPTSTPQAFDMYTPSVPSVPPQERRGGC